MGGWLFACGSGSESGTGTMSASATEGSTTMETSGPTTSPTSAVDSGSTSDATGSDTEDGPIFDVGIQTDVSRRPGDVCKVPEDDISGVGPCEDVAPPDSFEPDVQWSFTGPNGAIRCLTPPLVANLTDDDGNGVIDLCDTPDVVAVAGAGGETGPGHIFVLDGETGEIHLEIQHDVGLGATPAIGDIDGDGLVEIVAVEPTTTCNVVAFEHDGTLKWTSDVPWSKCQTGALAIADLDADGNPEIIGGSNVWSNTGKHLFSDPFDGVYSASTAADLDGDGQLEASFGHAAYRADGTVYYTRSDIQAAQFSITAFPQVANLDDDPEPEVLVAVEHGIWLLDHEGEVVWSNFAPTGESGDWNRPVNVHDFDGDDRAEFGISALQHYGVYEADHTQLWVANIVDYSGQAGGTAFDFLGQGKAQAIYADETNMWVFDDDGSVLFSSPRSSGTWIEYPTVADIDNDGSAEILIGADGGSGFTVRAIRDVEDRWIPARRIWNQHTYHVTNVREDGTIPQVEPPHWLSLNTFRTQAQIVPGGGGVCDPEPRG